jgi:hypothetical protein
MDIREIGCENVNWIRLAYYRIQIVSSLELLIVDSKSIYKSGHVARMRYKKYVLNFLRRN